MFSDELKRKFGTQNFTSLVIRNNVGYNRILDGRIENNQCIFRCTDKYICPRQHYIEGQNYPEHEEVVRINDVVDEIAFPLPLPLPHQHNTNTNPNPNPNPNPILNIYIPEYIIYDLSYSMLDPDYPMGITSIYVQI